MVKSLKELCFDHFYSKGISNEQKDKLPIELKEELEEYIKNKRPYLHHRPRRYSRYKKYVADRSKKSKRISYKYRYRRR